MRFPRNVVILGAASALALSLTSVQSASAAPSTRVAGMRPAVAGAPAPGASAKLSTTLAKDLSVPWGMAFLPTKNVLISQRDAGTIVRVTPSGTKKTIGKVAGVVSNGSSGGEAGLLGLALSPSYAKDGWLYAYVSTRSDNRVVRMQYHSGVMGASHVILKGIPKGLHHNGGGLAFSNYGMLYISTGDAGDSSRARNKSSLGGKILRVWPDGAIPASNPFKGSAIWSYGHRNVEGLAFDSANRLWATEFGEHAYDELNLIVKGHNYGWPNTEGKTTNPRYTSPKVVWATSAGGPSSIAIRNGVAWIGALTGKRLYRVALNGTTAGKPTSYFIGTYGRIRSVHVAPGGYLLIGTSNRDGRGNPSSADDRLLRLSVS